MKKKIRDASLHEWIAQEHPDVDAAAISDTVADWLKEHRGRRMRDQDTDYWENYDGADAFLYLAYELTKDADSSFKEKDNSRG